MWCRKSCHQANVEIFNFSVMNQSHMTPMSKSRAKVKNVNWGVSLTYDLNCFFKERKRVFIWLNNSWTLYVFHWQIKITEFRDEENSLGHEVNFRGCHALHCTIYFPHQSWLYMFLGMKFLNQPPEVSAVLYFVLTVSSLDCYLFLKLDQQKLCQLT